MTEDLLQYDKLVERALKNVVREALMHVSTHGLPGAHHLYITFRTDHPGVSIPDTLKAKYPLREARVDVTDVPGKPGAYNAVVFLRPHFQLEELTASIRLVAELPPPAAA